MENFTPKLCEKLDMNEKRKRGMRKMAEINRTYYGSGPTLWKCQRIDDTWWTLGELEEKCIIEPCVCPKKEEKIKQEKEFAYPTLMSLKENEKDLIKCSWKARGIDENVLAMMWFSKLFKRNLMEINEEMPSLRAEELFLDEINLNYVYHMAKTFDKIVNNLHRPHACSKLISAIAIIHSSLDVTDKYFQTLKSTLLETLKENMFPKPSEKQLKVWKTFIDIMFDIAHDAYLWNKWPKEYSIGTKTLMEIFSPSFISDTTMCSDDDELYFAKKDNIEQTGSDSNINKINSLSEIGEEGTKRNIGGEYDGNEQVYEDEIRRIFDFNAYYKDSFSLMSISLSPSDRFTTMSEII